MKARLMVVGILAALVPGVMVADAHYHECDRNTPYLNNWHRLYCHAQDKIFQLDQTIKRLNDRIADLEQEKPDKRWTKLKMPHQFSHYHAPLAKISVFQYKDDPGLFRVHFEHPKWVEYSVRLWNGESLKDAVDGKEARSGLGYVMFNYDGTARDLSVCITEINGRELRYLGIPTNNLVQLDGKSAWCQSFGKVSLGYNHGRWN